MHWEAVATADASSDSDQDGNEVTFVIQKKLWLTTESLRADINKNGTNDYCEFITATMDRYKLEKEGNLFEAFQYFDKDNNESSCYTMVVLLSMRIVSYSRVSLHLQDGRISYQDFVTMMRSKC
ncbi:hypothetical protein RJT34_24283 [Clitoria ternatea]|uniref:Uncharacterized protein n=1 Tax=Clitoria ternatea TaxID=43366 RepID=A0AAN9FMM2_CLITE